MRAIIDARYPAQALGYDGPLALVRLCGVPLIIRLLYALKNSGVREAVIVAGPHVEQLSSICDGEDLGIKLSCSSSLREALDTVGEDEVLLVPANLVASESLFELLTSSEGPSAVVIRGGPVGAIKARAEDVRAALNEGARRAEEIAASLLASGRARGLDPFSFEVHEHVVRRVLHPLCILVRDKASWLNAKRAVVFRTQKGLHFTGYMNKPIEDRIVYHISERTWITPNAITVIGNVLAFSITPLFIMGYFLYASLLAYLVGIIDGLDGKLARSRGFLTKLGHIEHSFDMLFEQTWYLSFALGLYLSYGLWWLLLAGGAFLVLDTFVRHVYMQFKDTMGIALTAASPLDRRFALVDGRRNMYLLYMIVSSALGFFGISLGPFPMPVYALFAMLAHAWITALFYVVRACQHMREADEASGVLAWMRLAKKAPKLKKLKGRKGHEHE